MNASFDDIDSDAVDALCAVWNTCTALASTPSKMRVVRVDELKKHRAEIHASFATGDLGVVTRVAQKTSDWLSALIGGDDDA